MEDLKDKLLAGKWVSWKDVLVEFPTRTRVSVTTRHTDILIEDTWYQVEFDKRGRCKLVKAVEPRWA